MKKGLLLSFAILTATFAQADYYVKWVIDEAGSSFPNGFSYASLFYGQKDALASSTLLYSYNMQTGGETEFPSNWEKGDGFQVADVGMLAWDYSDCDFFAVAYDSDDAVLALSDNVIAGSDIDLYRLNDGVGDVPDFSKETMTFTFSVPEPTSALLLLFGLGALALKRKA